MGAAQGKGTSRTTLYTEDQRQRRDTTRWTLVQGILAPLQFVVFVVSLGMVVRYLLTGERPASRYCVRHHQDAWCSTQSW
jgi:3-vinyl bacteriochlorophyllide hydratase